MATEKSALEILAEEELEKRRSERYKKLMEPYNEQRDKEEAVAAETAARWGAILKKRREEREAEERARIEAEEREKVEKPERQREAMRDLLHRSFERIGYKRGEE